MRTFALTTLLLVFTPAGAEQQLLLVEPPPGAYERVVPPALRAEARISEEQALATALARVPNTRVLVLELEREDGRLIYSFDLKVPGKRGHYEVDVDALTGGVLRAAFEP